MNGEMKLVQNVKAEEGGALKNPAGHGSVSLVLMAEDGTTHRIVTFLTKGTLYRHKIPANIGFDRTEDGRVLVK